MKYHPKYIIILFLVVVTNLAYSQNNNKISSHLHNQVENNNLLSYDINYTLTSEHISSISNVHHIYFNQTLNGIEILNTGSSIHIGPNNEEIMFNNSFIKDCLKKSSKTSSSIISGKKVIQSVAQQLQYKISKPIKIVSQDKSASKKIIMSSGGISIKNIPLELKYYLNDFNELILIWELSIFELSEENIWQIIVDATSGKIIRKTNRVINCKFSDNQGEKMTLDYNKNLVNSTVQQIETGNNNGCENCYEVLKMPFESPYFAERSLVIDPANLSSSPYGWHNDDESIEEEYIVTKGNNIEAYVDNDENLFYQPNGGEMLNFSGYEFNQVYSDLDASSDASITNVFYWGNLMHDILYKYGFTENAGNFQENNFEKGGLGEDRLVIRAQSTKNLCNAFYRNSEEGVASFIELNICQDRDLSFDNHVLVHEYNHGTSTRLIGGLDNIHGLTNIEQMGEGWSDWYGLMMMIKPGDTSEEPKGFATYLLGQGPNGVGIRDYPYSTNLEINPLTYDDIKTTESRHKIGAVWAMILWELTWELIEEYGFDPDYYNFTGNLGEDAGNVMAMAIVTEALKFTRISPGFIDARDGVLAANSVLYGRDIECILWRAFSKRGLGIYASQGSTFINDDGVESFEPMPRVATLNIKRKEVCLESTIQSIVSDGLPYGGVYSGPGVVDLGDGNTYTFNPTEAGLGVHTITYEVPGGLCSEMSIATDSVEVFVDTEQPVSVCPEEISVLASIIDSTYSIDDFSSLIQVSDNCTVSNNFTQEPPVGTIVSTGITNITMYTTDISGNNSTCNFNVRVEAIVSEVDQLFKVFPNPTDGTINILSLFEIEDLSVVIMDINSRLIVAKDFKSFGFEKTLHLESLSAGMYFVRIQSKKKNQIIQLIKR